jgi:hypothetical protein
MDMKSTFFYLDDSKTRFVKIDFDENWNRVEVYFDDNHLGTISSQEDFKTGRSFSYNKDIIYVKLKTSIFDQPSIEVLINGEPYNYKEPTNLDIINKTFRIILITSICALLATINLIGFNLTLIIPIIVFGIIVGLGFLFKYKESEVAILAVILMYIILFIYNVFIHIQNSSYDLIELVFKSIIYSSLLIGFMIQGLIRLKRYKKEKIKNIIP